MVAGHLSGSGWSEGLAWLAGQAPAPVIVVGEMETDRVVEALGHGAIWLPGEAVSSRPALLSAVLDQAVRLGRERQQIIADRAGLRACQSRVDRLLALLWEAVPGEGPSRWFTQRHMLERLDEEVSRSRRYGAPLSVVLGELQDRG